MKWTPINRPGTSLNEYHLAEDEHTLAILKFNPHQQSARIAAGDKQQVFFIERSGSNANRMVVENEYGVKMGSYMATSIKNKSGEIIIHDDHYHFKLLPGSTSELSIHKPGTSHPLATCAMPLTAGQTITSMECCALLLGLCWHLFVSQPAHNAAANATATRKEAKQVHEFVIN